MKKNNQFTLSEITQDFLNAKKAERLSHYTIRSYGSITRIFKNFFEGDPLFSEITSREIRAFLASKDHLKDKTVYNYHICLCSMWTFAVVEGIVEINQARKVPAPRVPKLRIIPFTRKEIQKMLDHADHIRDRVIILLLLDTGIRGGELASLRIRDFRDGYLKVLGKGRKERILPISQTVKAAIYEYLDTRRIVEGGLEGGQYLFSAITRRGTDGFSYNALQAMLYRLRAKSGVDDIHAHRFRHTFAINFLRNDGDVYSLKKILGHSSLKTVQIYLDIAQADIERAHLKASPVSNWHLHT